MRELTILVKSHHFVVKNITPRARPAIFTFTKSLIQFGFIRATHGRYVHTPLKVFAASTHDRSEYRFHINQLKEFIRVLIEDKFTDEMYEVIQVPMYYPAKISMKIGDEWKDRDYQIPIIEYLTDPNPPIAKFLPLQTGRGKSYCAMRAIQELGLRTLIIIRPMYVDKWVEDITRTYILDPEDIMVVKGSAQLMALLTMAKDEVLDSKIIIISNKTIQNWIKLYEQHKEESLDLGYDCLPEQLCETLGIGIRIIDEVHLDFHLNFKISLYTHVPHSFSLSATLLSDDDYIRNMQQIAYPALTRYVAPALTKYIRVSCLIYMRQYPKQIRTSEYGSKTYSHNAYEKSLIKHIDALTNYFKMIKVVIDNTYMREYKRPQKLLIFCASINLCTRLVDWLKRYYSELDVRRYVEEDEFQNLMQADITVSTILSAGAAVDIPDLTTVIMTTAISSSQANIQALGRLRELKDGTQPHFIYLSCQDVPKHMEYHERKKELFKDRASSIHIEYYGPLV